MAVIEKLKLPNEEVIFYTNKFKIPLNKFTQYENLDHRNIFQKIFKPNLPKVVDKYIDKITDGEKFEAFFDLMSYQQRIIATNKNCVNFNFIEEGMTCYSDEDDFTLYTAIFRNEPWRVSKSNGLKSSFNLLTKILSGYNSRLMSIPFNPNCYYSFGGVKFYGFSGNSYKYAPREKKQLLSFELLKPYIYDFNISAFNNELIWIEDSYTRAYSIDYNIESEAILKFTDVIKKKYPEKDKIYIKGRPKGNINNNLQNILSSQGFKVEYLSNNEYIELVLMNSKNICLLGNVSAVLYYGALMGHKSVSYFNLLKTDVRTVYHSMPSFWEKVERL
ncbi:MAG: hypothetical protein ACNS60_10460 [Candidatus Cyclobacteriaceae bacterium M2_1C_046]